MPPIMSMLPDFSENGKSSGRKPATSPEKSSFSHTCNLLSRYLKEKGSFGDLSLGMTCNLDGEAKSETIRPTTTMNLLPRMEISDEGSERKENVSDRNVTSMDLDLFPQEAGFGSSEDARKSYDTRPKVECETAQLTIFYGGRVHVFNDFPADRAKEIMLLASNGIPQLPGNERVNLPPNSTGFASTSNCNPKEADVLGLPIPRKASLHRFLEKRKERISSKAPYKLLQREESTVTPAPTSKTDSKSWLGLASLQPN